MTRNNDECCARNSNLAHSCSVSNSKNCFFTDLNVCQLFLALKIAGNFDDCGESRPSGNLSKSQSSPDELPTTSCDFQIPLRCDVLNKTTLTVCLFIPSVSVATRWEISHWGAICSITKTIEINVITAPLIDLFEFEFPPFRARMRRRRISRPAVSAAPHLEMLRGENPSPVLLSWRRGACVTPRRAGLHGGVSRLYIDTDRPFHRKAVRHQNPWKLTCKSRIKILRVIVLFYSLIILLLLHAPWRVTF